MFCYISFIMVILGIIIVNVLYMLKHIIFRTIIAKYKSSQSLNIKHSLIIISVNKVKNKNVYYQKTKEKK